MRRSYTSDEYDDLAEQFAILGTEMGIYSLLEMTDDNPDLKWEDTILEIARIVQQRRVRALSERLDALTGLDWDVFPPDELRAEYGAGLDEQTLRVFDDTKQADIDAYARSVVAEFINRGFNFSPKA
jgi:hypothetical protein